MSDFYLKQFFKDYPRLHITNEMLERLGWNHEAHPGLCTPPSPTARPQVPAGSHLTHRDFGSGQKCQKFSPKAALSGGGCGLRANRELTAVNTDCCWKSFHRGEKGSEREMLAQNQCARALTCFFPALEAGDIYHIIPPLLSLDVATQLRALQAQEPPCASQGMTAKCHTAPSASRINQKCIELPGNSILSARPQAPLPPTEQNQFLNVTKSLKNIHFQLQNGSTLLPWAGGSW